MRGSEGSAKDEFLEQIEGRGLVCAKLQIEHREPVEYDPHFRSPVSYVMKEYVLKRNYTEPELQGFLRSIDFEYDRRTGGQELRGLIWHTSSTWSERCQNYGTEWWEFKEIPAIPGELL